MLLPSIAGAGSPSTNSVAVEIGGVIHGPSLALADFPTDVVRAAVLAEHQMVFLRFPVQNVR
jgi:hypothetical protein